MCVHTETLYVVDQNVYVLYKNLYTVTLKYISLKSKSVNARWIYQQCNIYRNAAVLCNN